MRLSASTFTAIGFVAGVAFIVACPDESESGGGSGEGTTLGVGTATANHDLPASSCAQWEVQFQLVVTGPDQYLTPTVVDAGWEPIGGDGQVVILRRCM